MEADHKSYFASSGFSSAGFLNPTPAEAYAESQKNAVIVDVGEEELTEYKQFEAPQPIFLPNSRLPEKYSELPLDVPLIIVDSAGLRSKAAMIFLANKGFKNMANLAGGIMDWERDGFPVENNPSTQLSGQCPCMLKPMYRTKKT